MDILQISYFSKVYETLNYAHAAESLCVSRQGLRKVVRNLEREVGQPLFVNVANHLQPTEAAHGLYDASHAFVRGFRELEDAVTVMKLSQESVVRLGSTYDADDVFSPAELHAFRAYPTEAHGINIRLVNVKGSRSEMLEGLLSGTVDYVHAVFTELNESLFECRLAREGRIYLTVAVDHELADRDFIGLDDLRGRPVSIHAERNGVADLIALETARRGIALDIVRRDNELAVRLREAQDGRAATFTYRPMDDAPDFPGLVSIPFAEPNLTWRYGVVARKGGGDSYMMRYFAGEEIDWDAIARRFGENSSAEL